MNHVILIVTSFLFWTVDNNVKDQYISTYAPLAISEMHRTGIPASIKLAQALLESSAGNSVLSQKSNNHFGIKCKNYWLGDTYMHVDDDLDEQGNLIKSCFRAYGLAADSYVDHSNFILNSLRYSHLVREAGKDYKKWAHGLQDLGYATDPAYGQKLINIIEEFNLFQYDIK